jgi:hypothetical protein
MKATTFTNTIDDLAPQFSQLETALRAIRQTGEQGDEVVDFSDIALNLVDKIRSDAEAALWDAVKMQKALAPGVSHDRPTPAQRAGECAAQTLYNMQHADGLSGLFEAIESAAIQQNLPAVLKLAGLGRRTAEAWVGQLDEVHQVSIRAACGAT